MCIREVRTFLFDNILNPPRWKLKHAITLITLLTYPHYKRSAALLGVQSRRLDCVLIFFLIKIRLVRGTL